MSKGFHTTKYFGPPGTGKTTTLLRQIEQHLDEGVAPDQIAFISFSVKAAEEGKSRARARFGLDKDELVCVLQTRHGHHSRHGRSRHQRIFRDLQLSSDPTLPRQHPQVFGSDAGRPLFSNHRKR